MNNLVVTFSVIFCFSLVAGQQINANEKTENATEAKSVANIYAVSPQASDNTIDGNDGFTVDLVLGVKGLRGLTGGAFGIQFYSPDNSIPHLSHVDFNPTGNNRSIEFTDAWKGKLDAINLVNNDQPYGFDGNLPDSVYFTFAGFNGIAPDSGPKTMIRFHLNTQFLTGEGIQTLCVDSIGHGAEDGMDWLFPKGITATFNGPYCWQVVADGETGQGE